MTARRNGSGTSPWVWVGCGCALLAFIVAAALVGGGYFVFDKGREMVETMSDPDARDGKAAEILGAEALPAGYRSAVALEIPFVFKLVVIGDSLDLDEAPPEDADFETKAESMDNLALRGEDVDGRLFVYVRMRGRTDESIEGVLSGREKVNHTQSDLDFDFEIDEELGEGSFDDDGARIAWSAKRGIVGMSRDEIPAVWATLDVTCPGDERPMALWIERIGAPGAEVEADLDAEADAEVEAGSVAESEPAVVVESLEELADEQSVETDWADAAPADPSALEAFVRQFDLCA